MTRPPLILLLAVALAACARNPAPASPSPRCDGGTTAIVSNRSDVQLDVLGESRGSTFRPSLGSVQPRSRSEIPLAPGMKSVYIQPYSPGTWHKELIDVRYVCQ